MPQAERVSPTSTQNSSSSDVMNVDKFIASIMTDLKANKLELPTLPKLAFKISKVVESRDSNAKDVTQAVSTDPGLSVRLIQIANSPLVRSNRKIENVQMAVTRMGANMVRNIVTSFLLKQLFRTKKKALQKLLLGIWNHSAHVAAISHVLASRFTDIKPDEAMLAGLMHDIGKLPIIAKAKTLPNLENNLDALDVVLEKLHAPLGRTILQTWNFSQDFINVAAEHEKCQRQSERLDHTDIVIVANLLSHMGKPDRAAVDFTKVPALQKLSLDPEASIDVLKEAAEEIQEIQNLLIA